MARPSKSVRVKTGAIAGDDAAIRQDVEDKLRGENVPPEPPVDLTDGQREIFQFIVNGLVASDILGQLDVFVLESTAIAIDRLRYINGLIDADPGLVMHTSLQNARPSTRAICGGDAMSFASLRRPAPKLAVLPRRNRRRKRTPCWRP